MRELRIGPAGAHGPVRTINLRDLGFEYRVSPEALAEIAAAERRAMRVLTTAHLYRFGDGAAQQHPTGVGPGTDPNLNDAEHIRRQG